MPKGFNVCYIHAKFLTKLYFLCYLLTMIGKKKESASLLIIINLQNILICIKLRSGNLKISNLIMVLALLQQID